MFVLVLTHYFETHSDKLPSGHAVRRAGELVMIFMEKGRGFGPEAKVGQFTKFFQALFALSSVEKHNHTSSYIARNLSVIAGACRFATKAAIQKLLDGQLQEARLLKFMPEVCFDTTMSVKQRRALGGLAVVDNTRSINPGLASASSCR